MTTQKRTATRTAKRTKTTANSADSSADQVKQPAGKRTEPATTPAKLARKGRKLTEGAKLLRDLSRKDDDAAQRVRLTQAARLADRLEAINRLLSGDANAWLAVRVSGTVLELRVDDLVREERQLSEVLRKLIADIEKQRPAEADGDGDARSDDPVVRIVERHYGRKRA